MQLSTFMQFFKNRFETDNSSLFAGSKLYSCPHDISTTRRKRMFLSVAPKMVKSSTGMPMRK